MPSGSGAPRSRAESERDRRRTGERRPSRPARPAELFLGERDPIRSRGPDEEKVIERPGLDRHERYGLAATWEPDARVRLKSGHINRQLIPPPGRSQRRSVDVCASLDLVGPGATPNPSDGILDHTRRRPSGYRTVGSDFCMAAAASGTNALYPLTNPALYDGRFQTYPLRHGEPLTANPLWKGGSRGHPDRLRSSPYACWL